MRAAQIAPRQNPAFVSFFARLGTYRLFLKGSSFPRIRLVSLRSAKQHSCYICMNSYSTVGEKVPTITLHIAVTFTSYCYAYNCRNPRGTYSNDRNNSVRFRFHPLFGPTWFVQIYRTQIFFSSRSAYNRLRHFFGDTRTNKTTENAESNRRLRRQLSARARRTNICHFSFVQAWKGKKSCRTTRNSQIAATTRKTG